MCVCVCVCVQPSSVAYMYMCLWLTTWEYLTYRTGFLEKVDSPSLRSQELPVVLHLGIYLLSLSLSLSLSHTHIVTVELLFKQPYC